MWQQGESLSAEITKADNKRNEVVRLIMQLVNN
jgi:hypothetical protein